MSLPIGWDPFADAPTDRVGRLEWELAIAKRIITRLRQKLKDGSAQDGMKTRDQSRFPEGWGLVDDPRDPGVWIESDHWAGAEWGPYETRESAITHAWAIRDKQEEP